jgi:hypothetical protein
MLDITAVLAQPVVIGKPHDWHLPIAGSFSASDMCFGLGSEYMF